MSHHRHPVINTYNWVFKTLRNATRGIPRPLFSGDWGSVSLQTTYTQDHSIPQTYLPFCLLFILFQLYADSSSYFWVSGIGSWSITVVSMALLIALNTCPVSMEGEMKVNSRSCIQQSAKMKGYPLLYLFSLLTEKYCNPTVTHYLLLEPPKRRSSSVY